MRRSSVRGLRTFCAAARRLSFKEAAEELCVTPSAVSHQIKSLEQQLQGPLFERRTREVALTDLGATLFAQVEPLLAELDRVTARFLRRGQRRVLKVSLPPFFASEMFAPRLRAFADSQRALDIRVDTAEGGALPGAGGDASIALLPSRPSADLPAHALFALRLAPACSPQLASELQLGDPRALLATTLIVHRARPHAWQDWFASMAIALDRPPQMIHLDNMFAVARAAERGVGVALVPLPLGNSWFASGALVRPCIGELVTTERYYFVHRADAANDPDVRALRDWAIATFVEQEAERMSAVA